MNNIGMLKSTQAEVLASEDALHWVGFAGLQMHVWFFNLSQSELFRRLLLAAASAAAVRTGFLSFLSTGEANTYTPRRVWLTAADITRCHHSQVEASETELGGEGGLWRKLLSSWHLTLLIVSIQKDLTWTRQSQSSNSSCERRDHWSLGIFVQICTLKLMCRMNLD